LIWQRQVFQLHGVDERGRVVIQKRVSRSKFRATIAQLPACVIGMEACSSSQYWAREFQQMGHMVKLISPQFVRPYVKGNKNDSRDAEAICEAVSRPHMRFVPLKMVESQDIQALHRLRSRLIKERTALVNQIRGLLAERGLVIAQGITRLRNQLPVLVEHEKNELTPLSREVMRELYEELVALDERVRRADAMVQRVFTQSAACQKLAQVEGEQKRKHNHIPPGEPILFFEVTVCDASDFADTLRVKGVRVDGHKVLRAESAAVPNSIAAFLLHLRDHTGQFRTCTSIGRRGTRSSTCSSTWRSAKGTPPRSRAKSCAGRSQTSTVAPSSTSANEWEKALAAARQCLS
jgi:hypothetical protein